MSTPPIRLSSGIGIVKWTVAVPASQVNDDANEAGSGTAAPGAVPVDKPIGKDGGHVR